MTDFKRLFTLQCLDEAIVAITKRAGEIVIYGVKILLTTGTKAKAINVKNSTCKHVSVHKSKQEKKMRIYGLEIIKKSS